MKVQTIQPPPAIAEYVSSIVVLENNSMFYEAVLPLIAKGFPSITFQLTDPAGVLKAEKKSDALVLYGQNTSPIQLHIAGEVTVIAYFLFPYRLNSLFGYHAKELTDISVDLSLLPGPARYMNLKEQLLNAPALGDRLRLLDSYVSELCRKQKETDERVAFAARLIHQKKGAAPLADLQKELYVTERTLQRLFEQHVGLTPKMYSRICQFQVAFDQLQLNKFTDMTDVAFSSGYADQSHLIRAFRDFTRYSPLEYLKQAASFPG